MTELAVVQDEHSMSALIQWAEGARAANSIAVSLAKTPFVPKEMQGKPELVTAAILAGYEVGLQPMAALRSIDLIQGVPAMRAVAMRGLVQSKGHRITLVESTVTRAVVEGQRKGESVTQKSVWTMDRAKALGLAGKENWRKQPLAMLVARATAECCRLTASDVLLGLPYAVEELQDDDMEATSTAPAKPRRTARRKPIEDAHLPEPEVEPPAIEASPEPETPVVVAEEDGNVWPEPPPDWEPAL